MRCFILVSVSALAFAQPVLRWKVPASASGAAISEAPAVGTIAPGLSSDAAPARRHWVIQFAASPTAEDRAALAATGATVLQSIPDDAVLASAAALDLSGLNVTYAAPMEAAQKLSPLLRPVGSSRAGQTFLVEFHPDVDLNDARRLVVALGLELRDNPDLAPHHLMVRVPETAGKQGAGMRRRPPDPLPLVAARDEVAYIFPAAPELAAGRPVVPCQSAITAGGMLGQYIATAGDGWDGPGLGSATLGYFYAAVTDRLTADQVHAEIGRAMQQWSGAVQVDWKAGQGSSATKTVNILFARGNHGDSYPFDGPGHVLALTFYPAPPNPEPLAGDMHLDADEDWRVGANTDLFSVALHELGHALGLGHSDNPDAVMYPYYRMVSALSADDIAAVRTLYAARTVTADPTPPDSPAEPPSSPAPPEPPSPTPAPAPPSSPSPGDPSGGSPSGSDTTPPSLGITYPGTTTMLTSGMSITLRGTASDSGGVVSVTWGNNLGQSGVASGTTNWTATVPLLFGINSITVRAADTAGNSAWRTVVITRR